MRIVEDKPMTLVFTLESGEEKQVESTYFKQIKEIVYRRPKDGYPSDEAGDKKMKARIELKSIFKLALDAIEKGEEVKTVEIEEHQYDELKAAYSEWRWGIDCKDILVFSKFMKNIPEKE